MVIERNTAWGAPGEHGPDVARANSDAHAGALLQQGTTAMRLVSGDLARTLGVDGRIDRAPTGMLLPVDAIEVEFEDRDAALAVAHVQVGRAWGRKPFVVVMNAAHLGDANLAPRAHPGDGAFDVVEVAVGRRDRRRARRRAATGSHVPHPDIRIRRATEWTHESAAPVPVLVDGEDAGRHRVVRCRLRSEALTIGI